MARKQQLQITISPETLQKLQEQSQSLGMSMSMLGRIYLERAVLTGLNLSTTSKAFDAKENEAELLEMTHGVKV